MAHSLPEIEKDALRLSAEDRARLAVRLLSSLEEATESPEQIEKVDCRGRAALPRTARRYRAGDTRSGSFR